MKVYYNEFDPNAAQWLRNLGEAGQIAKGEVDERSIKSVRGADLSGFRRAHFFAGIGGWDYALKLAGWPEDREVWTGSCPCQPFSAAGKKKGTADERHLWPEFFRLISERRPEFVFGEQVARKAGLGWLDGVLADLEGIGYSCGAAVIGAHSVGAPHIRQRLYWVAHRKGVGRDGSSSRDEVCGGRNSNTGRPDDGGAVGGLADGHDLGRRAGHGEAGNPRGEMGVRTGFDPGDGGEDGGLADGASEQEHGERPTDEQGRDALERSGEAVSEREAGHDGPDGCGAVGPWSDYRIIPCTDGKARRTGSRVFPLAHGIPRGVGAGGSWRKGLARGASRARVGMLKGSGNAIVPALAAEFIRAFLETQEWQ